MADTVRAMQSFAGVIVWTVGDVWDHLTCTTRSVWADLAREGAIAAPVMSDDETLRARLGREHEARVLSRLVERYGPAWSLPDVGGNTLPRLRDSETRSSLAMGSDHLLVSQASFFDEANIRGPVTGRADFLERADVDAPWEVVEAKLATKPNAKHLFQAGWYSLQVARVTGRVGNSVHLELGDGTRRSFDAERVHRAVALLVSQARDVPSVSAAESVRPEPCSGCSVCRWKPRCLVRWREDDDVILVPNLSHKQRAKLIASGITRMHELGEADDSMMVPGMKPDTLAGFRAQAHAQSRSRSDNIWVELRAGQSPDACSGLWRLPVPDDGDVFFDFEGYQHYMDDNGDDNGDGNGDGKLEYLLGVSFRDGDERSYKRWWAHNRPSERFLLDGFLAWLEERRSVVPEMHAYHYGHYERTALRRLARHFYGDSQRVERLVTEGVFVDLQPIAGQGLVVGAASYSLKVLEKIYRLGGRDAAVTTAMDSVVQYARWLETGEQSVLDSIEAYNKDDCESTTELRAWLETWRAKLVAKVGLNDGDDCSVRDRAGRFAPTSGSSSEAGTDALTALEKLAGTALV